LPAGARSADPDVNGVQGALLGLADVWGELLLVFWCGHGCRRNGVA